jgi:hypothetical protein
MSKLQYAFADVYPTMASSVMTTTEQTIPEGDEREHYMDTSTVVNEDGQREVLDKNNLWIALAIFVVVLFLLHMC